AGAREIGRASAQLTGAVAVADQDLAVGSRRDSIAVVARCVGLDRPRGSRWTAGAERQRPHAEVGASDRLALATAQAAGELCVLGEGEGDLIGPIGGESGAQDLTARNPARGAAVVDD